MTSDLTSLLKNAFGSSEAVVSDSEKEVLKPGERRDAAVLFLDLVGFTELSGTLDHETVHELTKSIMNELVRTAHHYHGYVDKIEGDRIMVLFGAVTSGENDSRTAVLCAFKMLEVLDLAGKVLKGSGLNLGARIGIACGPLTVAPDAIGHLTAMGSTVNLASRMEEKASLNTILVSDRVHSMCSNCATWFAPIHHTVKGVKGRITCWSPEEPLRPGNELVDDVRFTGRKAEYARLKEILKLVDGSATGSSPDGTPRHVIVEINGEAGSGKARLALEFIGRECDHMLFLRGRALGEGQPAHWLWSSVVSNLLGFQVQKAVSWNDFLAGISRFCHPEDLSDALTFLGKLIPALSDDPRLVTLDSSAITLETRLAIRDFFECLAARKSLVVFLEDVHWMDSTDAKLLEFLLKNCSTSSPILFILTGRDAGEEAQVNLFRQEDPYHLYSHIELGELSRKECGEMASAIAERFTSDKAEGFTDHALDLIHAHSSGNPFFLRELVLKLLESEAIELRGGLWTIADPAMQPGRPETLTGLLQSRLDNLPEEWKRTLMICAVLGTEFLLDTYKMVCASLGVECAEDTVFQGLIDRQMLVRSDSGDMKGFRFRHPLIQRTACESNLSSNLKLIHRAAAKAIEELFVNDEDRIAAKLATHWEGAGEISRAAGWGIRAQKHALDNYQHTATLHWGEKLLSWLQHDIEEYLRVLEKIAVTYQYTGRSEDQLKCLERVEKLAVENSIKGSRAWALMEKGTFLRSRGKRAEALRCLEESLAICRENGLDQLESNALGNLGVHAAETGDLEKAREYFSEAERIHLRLGNKKGEASTLGNLGIMLRNMGDPEGAAEKFERALSIFRELGDIRSEAITMGNLGNIRHDQGLNRQAHELYEKALGIFTRIGDRRSMGVFLGNLGLLHADMGEEDEAEEYYRKAIAISMETGNLRLRGWMLSNRGTLRLRAGEIPEADSLYNRALELFTKVNDPVNIAATTGATGYTAYLQGRVGESVVLMKKALEAASSMGLPPKEFQDTLVVHHGKLREEHPEIELPDLPDGWS